MYDDRMFARVLRQDREDEIEKRRLIREAERARAAERFQGQKVSHAAQTQQHPGSTRSAA